MTIVWKIDLSFHLFILEFFKPKLNLRKIPLILLAINYPKTWSWQIPVWYRPIKTKFHPYRWFCHQNDKSVIADNNLDPFVPVVNSFIVPLIKSNDIVAHNKRFICSNLTARVVWRKYFRWIDKNIYPLISGLLWSKLSCWRLSSLL